MRSPARELLLYEQFRRGSFRVVACSGRYGIRPGMSLAEATALGNVECQEHDPLADRAALTKLAGWCEQFGPIVGIEEPDNLLVDVTGLGSLFGGEERLAEQVMRAFQRLGLTARVAIADTVGAAWAISHFEKEFPIVIPPGNTASALAILPVAALRISPSMIELLAELGLTQIGQLQSLPREAMAARFDPQLCLRLDQATGLMAEPILSHRPLPEITAHMQLEDSIRDRAALEVALDEIARSNQPTIDCTPTGSGSTRVLLAMRNASANETTDRAIPCQRPSAASAGTNSPAIGAPATAWSCECSGFSRSHVGAVDLVATRVVRKQLAPGNPPAGGVVD